jgi:putative ABC transport system ATP-binding protein
MKNILEIRNISKTFHEQCVLKDFSADIEQGSFTTISGESGSGKSTLMNLIGLLDSPDSGEILYFDHQKIKPYSRQASKMLRDQIGYLFQNFALIDEETVRYNLLLALEGSKFENKDKKISDALKKVGLAGFADKKIYHCSGGEQQRIAIARLLIKPKALILADEPTGSLDTDNKWAIMNLLQELRQNGATLIIITHDPEIIDLSDQKIVLEKN